MKIISERDRKYLICLAHILLIGLACRDTGTQGHIRLNRGQVNEIVDQLYRIAGRVDMSDLDVKGIFNKKGKV